MDETTAELPPGIDLLWGRRDRSRRGGPKPVLTLDGIVGGAIALADEGGLPALSMGRLAERLGFTTMSLYRYVTSKQELMLLVFDAAIGPPPPVDPTAGWRAAAEAWARANLELFRRHPWSLDVPVSGLPAGPNQLRWLDRGLAALAGTALTEDEKASSVLLLTTYARTAGQLARDLVEAERLARESGTEGHPWSRTVTALIDPDGYPALTRAVAAGVFSEDDGEYPDHEFDFGLQRVLDGIEALDRTRPAPHPAPLPPLPRG